MSKSNQYSAEKLVNIIKEFADAAQSPINNINVPGLFDSLDDGTKIKLGDAFVGLNGLDKAGPKIRQYFSKYKAVANLMKHLASYADEMAKGDAPSAEKKELVAAMNADLTHFLPGQMLGDAIVNMSDDHGTAVRVTYTARWTDKGPTVDVVGTLSQKFAKEVRIENAMRESREELNRELFDKLKIPGWKPTHTSYDFPMVSLADADSRVAGSEQVTSTAAHHLTGAKLAYLAQSVIALRANDIGIGEPAALAAYPQSVPVLLAASH